MKEVLEALRSGRGVVVADDADRENEGDVIFAADRVTASAVNFCAVHARGLICAAMAPDWVDRLRLPLAPKVGIGMHPSPFTVSVEAASGVTTGISAADRAHTLRLLGRPDSRHTDFVSPGHIFPLRAHSDGLAGRQGHTEAGVALAALAGCSPVAVLCEIMDNDGGMRSGADLQAFARQHDMPFLHVRDIPRDQPTTSAPSRPGLRKGPSTYLPTRHAAFSATVYVDPDGLEHMLLRLGHPESGDALVRVHSECLTGDAFGSLRCDCGDQLDQALARIAADGNGALVYLRQEGRGIGLANKMEAYALQEGGLDTVDANQCLGFPADARSYEVAAAILADAGIERCRLLTNNPRKMSGLLDHGITISRRMALGTTPRPENSRYLNTKIERLDHVDDLIIPS